MKMSTYNIRDFLQNADRTVSDVLYRMETQGLETDLSYFEIQYIFDSWLNGN